MERSIRECLEKMKRRELACLGFRMNMPPPGRRGELADWRDMAAGALPQLGATVRECLGYKGVVRLRGCLAEAADEDGSLLVTRSLAAEYGAQLELGTLRRIALAWQDRHGWHVQPCVVDMLTLERGEKSLLEASDDLFLCTRGYLLHYGMLPVTRMQEMILGHTDEQAANVVLAVYARRCSLDGVVFMPDETVWLCLPELPDPGQLAAEVLRPDRQLIEYAKVTEDDARRAAREGVTGDQDIIGRLVEAGRRSGAPKRLILADLGIAEGLYQQDEREMAIATALTHLDDDRQAVGELLADRYFNTVPVWRVKGHTVLETREEKSAAHVGWRDRCPCGSGRIWGACCGRAQ